MKEILTIFNYVDGKNDTLFYDENDPIKITEYTYSSQRMGNVSLSATLMHKDCLDNYWDGQQYVIFRGERYFIFNTPSSSKSNSDARYKHDIDFFSERYILYNTLFYDAVSNNAQVDDKYQSNSTKVFFYGDIREFAQRLNASLKYSGVPYDVVLDEGITSEPKEMSFENRYFFDVLQEMFQNYDIPFYFVGRKIHIGYTNNAITNVFKYGAKDSLLSVEKNNANYKIVTRCTGIGNNVNIPFYYPNASPNRDEVVASGKKWITPSPNLMPPIYRESEGAERFYNAKNNTYTSSETGEYYTFKNEYTSLNPREQITSFPYIQPTIQGMTNASKMRIDEILDVAFDTNDNDKVNEKGEYEHPFFFIKLRKFDGDYGFNLFEHAIVDNTAMTISMKNGQCGACNFEIAVLEKIQNGKQVFLNTVQKDRSGNVKRDKNGNVLFGDPQPFQQNTMTDEVWIALRKEESTFGIIMPNKESNFRPKMGDNFVILYIDLPQAYITSAENRLKEAIIKYMYGNNAEKYNFSITFSRIYLAEHPEIAEQINENARIQVEYNGKIVDLYISQYDYSARNNESLPEIKVELSETITINKNTLQQSIDEVKEDIMGSFGNIDVLKKGLKHFLRKDVEDRAKKKITFDEGLDVGDYSPSISGGTFRKDADGNSIVETDKIIVRKSATFNRLDIQTTSTISGEQLITPSSARMQCTRVDYLLDAYRCYFTNEVDGIRIENNFVVGDQAMCKEINVDEKGSLIKGQYYWRLVVGVGKDYIDLSKDDADKDSTIPKLNDVIIQFGNRNDPSRQNAILLSSVAVDSPSIKLLQGIKSFDLSNTSIIEQGFDTISHKPFLNVFGNAFIGDKKGEKYYLRLDEKGLKLKGTLETDSGVVVGDELSSFEYLKTALESTTTIQGGLIATSVINTGKKNEDGSFTIKGGLNGVYDSNQKGGGISYWAGGDAIDREATNPAPANAAQALIRMDGTGYLANGAISWDSTGKISADPLSFFVGEETVGSLLLMFRPEKVNDELKSIIQLIPFKQLFIGNYMFDEGNGGLIVKGVDGSSGNLYATGELSAGIASDRRLKDDIVTIGEHETRQVLKSLNPVSFQWNKDAERLSDEKHGIARSFIADEFLEVIPNAGRKIWNDYDAIDIVQVIPYLVSGWKLQQKEIEDLKKEIKQLKHVK